MLFLVSFLDFVRVSNKYFGFVDNCFYSVCYFIAKILFVGILDDRLCYFLYGQDVR